MEYLILAASVLVAVLVYDKLKVPVKPLRDSKGVELKPWASIHEISEASKGAVTHEEIELKEAA